VKQVLCLLPVSSCYLAWLIDPEDGGDMFFRNVGSLLTDYTALYPRMQNSSSLNHFVSQSKCGLPFDLILLHLKWTSILPPPELQSKRRRDIDQELSTFFILPKDNICKLFSGSEVSTPPWPCNLDLILTCFEKLHNHTKARRWTVS
jgi:hypothetical protein